MGGASSSSVRVRIASNRVCVDAPMNKAEREPKVEGLMTCNSKSDDIIQKNVHSSESILCSEDTLSYGEYESTINTYLCAVFKKTAPLKPDAAKLVKESWSSITQGKTAYFNKKSLEKNYTDPVAFFAYCFFENLFIQIPRAQDFLRQDPHQRYQKLFKLVEVLQSIPTLTVGQINRCFNEVGKKHRQYRVRPSWYGQFGAILLQVVCEHLGEKATNEVCYAWVSLIRLLLRGLIHRYLKDMEEERTTTNK